MLWGSLLLGAACLTALTPLVVTETLYFKPLRPDYQLCGEARTYSCPRDSTCCPRGDGRFGCCPLKKAVSCPDKQHCCPEKSTCDVQNQRCRTADGTHVAWLRSVAARPLEGAVAGGRPSNDVVCGSGMRCHGNQSCCHVSSLLGDDWGCCPYAKGVCCKDLKHCCPLSYNCDERHQFCLKGSNMMPWAEIVVKTSSSTSRPENICPGGKWACSSQSTCCADQLTGDHTCCPFPGGLCCADHTHCCPAAYKCDVAAGKCVKARSLSIPLGVTKRAWLVNQPPVGVPILALSAVRQRSSVLHFDRLSLVHTRCPDGKSECPAGTTCCKMAAAPTDPTAPTTPDPEYGCCPLKQAVCCADGLHCCPHGSRCDVTNKTCDSRGATRPALRKLPARRASGGTGVPTGSGASGFRTVICPDQKSECVGNATCCKLTSGQYGCCPLVKAVCCSDHLHCCPEGSTCNVERETCERAGRSGVSWRRKTAAMPRAPSAPLSRRACPGGKGTCLNNQTCCLLPQGQYGCCLYSDAVCCDDHVSCCPEHTYCAAGNTCKPSPPAPTLLTPSRPRTPRANDIKCADNTSTCPDQTTCCQMQSGAYGCCPVVKAKCCSDHVHCCPPDQSCDVAKGACVGVKGRSPLLVKLPAWRPSARCGRNERECWEEGTGYWCCSASQGVCCPGSHSCCPLHSVCQDGACLSPSDSVPWRQQLSTRPTATGFHVCPAKKVACTDKQTCCPMQDGKYGCCPLVKATCCKDGRHCCPAGDTCDLVHRRCAAGHNWVTLSRGAATPPEGATRKCPGTSTECPDGSTCCKRKSGSYGCCALLNAVCCADGIHCCPQGTQCRDGACFNVIPVLRKTVARAVGAGGGVHEVICPGGKESCPSGDTCCKLEFEQWGCCPIARAVCCSDMMHCCPQGYRCNPGSQYCVKRTSDGHLVASVEATLVRLRP